MFCTRTGHAHNQNNVATRTLAKAVKLAGPDNVADASGVVVEHAPTFHTHRHTHGSMLIADGWDIAEVSARLGHSSANVTLGISVHEFEKQQRSSQRRDRLARLSVVADVVATDGSEPQQRSATASGDVAQIRAV